MITDRDIRDQLVASLGADFADFDIDGLVDAYLTRWGRVDIDDDVVDGDEYWSMVATFDVSAK